MKTINFPSIKKILVARNDVIGDMVLTTPIFKVLRDNFPQAEIYLYCQAHTVSIVKNNPFIQGCIIEKMTIRIKAEAIEIKKQKFDLFINSWENPDYGKIALLAGIPIRVGYYTNPLHKLLYTHSKVFPWKDNTKHQVEINLALLKAMGIAANISHYKPQLYIEKRETIDKVVIQVSRRGDNKFWTPDNFLEVIRHIFKTTHYDVELIGGFEDPSLGDYFSQNIASPRFINNFSKLSLEQTIASIATAKYFIGADSGPMHIAASYGIPLIALYITKHQKPLRWAPLNTRHFMLKADYNCPLVCNPAICREDYCTRALSVKTVTNAFDQLVYGKGKINDKSYWQTVAFQILLLSHSHSKLEKIASKLKDYRVYELELPKKLSEIKAIILNTNSNIIHIIDKTNWIKWKFLQIWSSNFMSTFPILVIGNAKNILEKYIKKLESYSK